VHGGIVRAMDTACRSKTIQQEMLHCTKAACQNGTVFL